jgi:hypothetical protein
MNNTDFTILVLMGIAALVSAVSFATIVRTLYDKGLADPKDSRPDIPAFYKTYMAHTKKQTGRFGKTFWVHVVSAGVFILVGAGYTIYRWLLPIL